MALITFNEIFDLAVMILAIGFIFKDYVPSPKKTNYDPLKELEKGISFGGKYFKGIKEGIIVAAPAVILHEAAHKIAAIFYGFEATFHAAYLWLGVGVFLKILNAPLLFFVPGYVTYSAPHIEPLTRSLIAFAGPLANLLLFLFATLALKKNWMSKHSQLLSLTKQINLFLLIFNLLPIGFFDGADVFGGLIDFFF